MTDEDIVAAKLKGHNGLIKFKDGETIFMTVYDIDTAEEANEMFTDTERFINNEDGAEWCPLPNIAIARDTIKYVKKI